MRKQKKGKPEKRSGSTFPTSLVAQVLAETDVQRASVLQKQPGRRVDPLDDYEEVRIDQTSVQIRERLKSINPGQSFTIWFRRNGMTEFQRLYGLFNSLGINLQNPKEEIVLQAVAHSGSFELDQNRVWKLVATDKWNARMFSDNIVRGLESIRLS